MTHPLFFHKLVAPACREVVFAHFQNPHAAKLTGLSCTAENASEPKIAYQWNRTEVSAVPRRGGSAELRIEVPFGRSVGGFGRLIGALNVGGGSHVSVFAVVEGRRVPLASAIEGSDRRFEIDVGLGPVLEQTSEPEAFELTFAADGEAPLVVILHWLGLSAEQPVAAADILRRSDHEYFFNGAADLDKPRFAK